MILLLSGVASYFPAGQAQGQEMLGSTLGNFSGVNGLLLNPSAIHNSKTYLDIQLLGANLSLQNNYLFMKKYDYRFSNFFRSGYQWPTHSEDYGTEERIFYHYANTRDKNLYLQARVDGPGAMLTIGKHAFALTTAVRAVLSGSNIPHDVANFLYLGLNYRPQQGVPYHDQGRMSAAAMAWAEIGLTYGNVVYARGFDRIAAGITVRRLLGYGGMYFSATKLDYTVLDDSTLDVRNMQAEVGMSLPVGYDNNSYQTSPLVKGGGFSTDIGVTYTRLARYHQPEYFNSLCAQPYEDYRYRVGIAVIDFGGIRFSDHALRLKIDNRSSYWEHVTHMNFRTVRQLLDTVSYKFYGNNTEAYDGERFTLWLPTALSVQFDYHLKNFWYLNASLVQGIPVTRKELRRPSELSITPRYESRWFEASLPVSFYDWQTARVGLALRAYGFTIGTDKLGGFLHISDFTGLDFYFSLRFFLDKGNCRLKGPVHCGTLESHKIRK